MKSNISFTVRSIECIACTPVFKRNLDRLKGVISVKSLSMMNKIIVEFDSQILTTDSLKEEIQNIAAKAKLAGRIVFG